MPTAKIITEDLIRSVAANTSAVTNGLKISRQSGFTELKKTSDETLIFGVCRGSGSSLYSTSIDFSGDSPVFRCSCPSRQIPCKHCLGLMFDWTNKKEFTISEVPDDITSKRDKIAKKAEKTEKAPPKQNKTAAAKKLKKQKEGLELAESFVNDLLSRGVSSVTSSSAAQYKNLAKQLGDYYLPEPQALMTEIVSSAQSLSEKPDDSEIQRITALCVRLSSAVRKSMDYIDKKLESGEVLPEDSILYEAMGNVWKLSQLKEIGLYKENARIIQLSFTVLYDDIHAAEIDKAYWCDLDTGEISQTENIRPLRAAGYIKSEDSSFGVHNIKTLYHYPGGINKRIRWDSDDISDAEQSVYFQLVSKSENSISDAVKKAKNELKNTLSSSACAFLIPFDEISFCESDKHPVLKYRDETITMRSDNDYPDTTRVLSVMSGEYLKNGALLGELFYAPEKKRIYLCPLSIVNYKGIIRLH